MKTISGGMLTILQTKAAIGGVVECYTFTLRDQTTIFRFNTGDTNIVLAGNTFLGTSIRIERATLKQSIGVQPDELQVDIYPSPNDALLTINGIAYTFLQAITLGLFDAADVKVERCVMPTWGDTSLGSVVIFQGRISNVDAGRSLVTLNVRDYRELLNLKAPKSLIQPSCRHTLYDGGCTLARASFLTAGVTLINSTINAILITNAQATGYFDLGTLTYTSGQNLNQTRTVKSFLAGTPATLNLQFALPYVPVAGDTFNLYPGCDHTQATCLAKFANLIHFGGFPYVPQPETAI